MTQSLFLATLATFASPSAEACGGFFCQAVPVDQAAERIVFAIDEKEEIVEVQVQITYEGDAEDFAWVLPVPAQPELRITVDDVFNTLRTATRPAWNLAQETEGSCREGGRNATGGVALDAEESDDGGFSPPQDPGNGVTVVDEGPIGPYETKTLLADDAEALLTYLQDNGYQLPDDLSKNLDPYVADGSYFVALRLQKDKSAGDLRPLALTYAGTEAQIPLQLTAIAATPDMRLQPYVLGSARAVPENYLHVVVNELVVDWWGRRGQLRRRDHPCGQRGRWPGLRHRLRRPGERARRPVLVREPLRHRGDRRPRHGSPPAGRGRHLPVRGGLPAVHRHPCRSWKRSSRCRRTC